LLNSNTNDDGTVIDTTGPGRLLRAKMPNPKIYGIDEVVDMAYDELFLQ